MNAPMSTAEFRAYMDAAPMSITLSVDVTIDLTVEEVWPDGDAPTEITAEAVVAQMGRHPRALDVIRDWCLPLELDVRVDRPNPHWNPSPPLIPELAPKARIVTTATVR